jgi:hypothetical protein
MLESGNRGCKNCEEARILHKKLVWLAENDGF